MAQRRMFSPDIVCSEEFLSMPVSSRALYYHLGMQADDDGFIQPQMSLRVTGANSDDLKILLAKRFLLTFETGVVVIKHWLIHNMIRADRYKRTRFTEEKSRLKVKENKAYTDRLPEWQPNGNQPAPQVRLGQVRLGKKYTSAQSASFSDLWEIYPRKENKKKAEISWKRLSEKDHAAIMADVPKRKGSFQWQGGFIPHLTTYINGRRWEDEIVVKNGVVGNITKVHKI